MKKKKEYFAMSQLKERGWTATLIKKYATVALTKENPMFKSAAPMKLYKIDDIKKAERTKKFKLDMETAKTRSDGAKKRAEKQRLALIKEAKSVELKFFNLPRNLEKAALNAKQRWYDWTGQYDMNTYGAPKNTVERWERNYLRHECSDYEDILDDFKGRVGVRDAYTEIRAIIDKKVDEKMEEIKNAYKDKDLQKNIKNEGEENG